MVKEADAGNGDAEMEGGSNGKCVLRSDSPAASCCSSSAAAGLSTASESGLRFRSHVDLRSPCAFSSGYLDSESTGKTSVAIQVPSSFPLPHAQCPLSSSSYSTSGGIVEQRDSEPSSAISRESFSRGLTELLRDLNLAAPEQGDGENGILQWLQALELHVVGACRADERLRPLLRWNLSCFGADGHLLGRLGLHFKAKEVAMLARCLCAPLVSVRVGKINSHGRLLRPTNSRGHLDLTMLPSSDLRLSFLGDGGTLERLAVVTRSSEDTFPVLECIRTDSSGRSFVIKLRPNRSLFFWQSEKSKTAGDELISKMKDILKRRPTLCELTGIHESRLESIASYLRTLIPPVPSPCPAAVSTRTSESAIVPPGFSTTTLAFPCLSHPLAGSAASSCDAEMNVVCSETVSIGMCLALTGQSLGTICPSSTGPPATTSQAAAEEEEANGEENVARASGGGRLFRNSGEVDKKAFAQRILESLPQTFVPFPLLVSGAATSAFIPALSPSVPVSTPSLFTPYYCPCPLGNVSTFQFSSFTSPNLPAVPPSVAPLVSVGPSPPLISPPPLNFPLVSSGVPLGSEQVVSGPLFGVVLPLRPESSAAAAAAVLQGGLADFLEVYTSASFPGKTLENERNEALRNIRGFSTGLTNLYCQPAFESQPVLVPGVLSSSSLSRMISFCPDRVSTSSARVDQASVPHSLVTSHQVPPPSAESIPQVCTRITSNNNSSNLEAHSLSVFNDTKLNDTKKRPQ